MFLRPLKWNQILLLFFNYVEMFYSSGLEKKLVRWSVELVNRLPAGYWWKKIHKHWALARHKENQSSHSSIFLNRCVVTVIDTRRGYCLAILCASPTIHLYTESGPAPINRRKPELRRGIQILEAATSRRTRRDIERNVNALWGARPSSPTR